MVQRWNINAFLGIAVSAICFWGYCQSASVEEGVLPGWNLLSVGLGDELTQRLSNRVRLPSPLLRLIFYLCFVYPLPFLRLLPRLCFAYSSPILRLSLVLLSSIYRSIYVLPSSYLRLPIVYPSSYSCWVVWSSFVILL